MRKLCWVLEILFAILTLIGAGYVLKNDGQVSAGYACVPMLFTLAFSVIGRSKKQQ